MTDYLSLFFAKPSRRDLQTNEKNVLVISFFFFSLSDVAVFRLVFFKLIPCIACCGYCNPDLWFSFSLSLPKLSSVL